MKAEGKKASDSLKTANHLVQRPAQRNVPPMTFVAALVISVTGTALLGAALFALQANVWWISLASILSLFGGGIYLGHRSREPEPLYGTLLAIPYFGLVVGVLFGGELAEVLPDPLPGLAIGDSTFFFVWPLLQLTASVMGSVVGGHLSIRQRER